LGSTITGFPLKLARGGVGEAGNSTSATPPGTDAVAGMSMAAAGVASNSAATAASSARISPEDSIMV
jgi:hypothetical protein